MSSILAKIEPCHKLYVFVHPSNFNQKQISRVHLQSQFIFPYLFSKPLPEANHSHKVSPGDLLSSAKVVADAAESSLRHEGRKADKGRVADAAADLLCAASHYGKLEEELWEGLLKKH